MGSGDFHHLASALLLRIEEPFTLVSFDNHPDWDIRPPRWACGGWVNRALELSTVERAAVWGCGNFELSMPSRLFANRRALRSGRLEVHAWAERMSPSARRRFDCMTRDTWRQRFEDFAVSLAGKSVYVTVDLDCLDAKEAVTNWENGLFTADDIAWALRLLQDRSRVVGGDLCGAYSAPQYSRPFQRFAGWWDHPKIPDVDLATARDVNQKALLILWPALTGR
jgi:arginase family enzyme